MRATSTATKMGVRPARSGPPLHLMRLRRTHLAPLAIQFILHLRWLAVFVALSIYLVGPRTGWVLPLVLAICGFNGLLYLAYRRGRHPPIFLTAAADSLVISLLIVQRGGALSESYLLYGVPIFYLGLYYAWTGAIGGGLFMGLSYAATLLIASQTEPPPSTFDIDSRLVVRGIYFVFVTALAAIVVREQERSRRRIARMHARSREQVRRLEAIGRITQKLNTLPTGADVARVIVEETRGVIPFKNCRVHRIEEGPEGVWLTLAAFYGQPSDEEAALPASAWKLRLGEGISGWVALQAEPALVDDASNDPRARHVPGTPQEPVSLLAVPLTTNRRVKGVITLNQDGAHAFGEDDLHLMVTLANAAAIALDNIESRESLARQAVTDAVTGLPHHGAFLSALSEGLRLAEGRGEDLALVMLDVDGFRGYNERMGLAEGDEALRYVGARLDTACRRTCREVAEAKTAYKDPCGGGALAQTFRVGGDEFALLLRGPLSRRDPALTLARECIQAVAAPGGGDMLRRVTVSAGLAFFPDDATTGRELLDVAEAALYLVKQTGGNRLGLADAPARETLHLRHRLEEMVRATLADSGSAGVVQQLVAEAANLTQHARHASLAEQLTAEALRALAAAIDAKDDYTRGHSERVAATATEIARYMDLPGALVDNITTAARMHDIGKIGVPDQILHKSSALTPVEQAIVAAHPEIGADILSPIHTLRDLVPIVRHHHEHWDGKGYPDGLTGEAIPIGARVIAVADTIDAMVTDRPYRRGMPITAALAELHQWAGSHYDPQVVEAAVALYAPSGGGLALHGVAPAPVPAELDPPLVQLKMSSVLDMVMYPEPVRAPVSMRAARPAHDGLDDRAGGQE